MSNEIKKEESVYEEARRVVAELNDENRDGDWIFIYSECSYACSIRCGSISLWDSENDDRSPDEDDTGYKACLKSHIVAKLAEVVKTLSDLLKGDEK